MAEARPGAGTLNFSPDAADSIPGERQPTDINWVNKDRKDSNSNQNRSNLSFPSLSSERGTNYESSSTKHRGFCNPESQYGNSEDFHQCFNTSKSLKNRNLPSQRLHRSRNDSTCTRNKIRQSTAEAAAGPGISDVAIVPSRRAPPRGYNDFLSSESDREVPNADSRGAKPKKTHLMHASGRDFRERGKQVHDREKRVSSNKKVELFENVPSLDLTQSDSSESSVGKAFCDAPVGSGDEQKGYNYVNKRYPRKPVWNKPSVEKECQKRHDSHRSKNTKVGKKSSTAYTPKDKNERKKELPVHKNDENLTKEVRHQLSESLRLNGRKFLLKGDQAPALHFSWTQYWKKQSDVPKNKETHTGSLIEQLTTEKYECMVCCEVVRIVAPVWSCQNCYHVFHLNCIKKWARSPASQAEDVMTIYILVMAIVVGDVQLVRMLLCKFLRLTLVSVGKTETQVIFHTTLDVADILNRTLILLEATSRPPCQERSVFTEINFVHHSVRCGQSTKIRCSNSSFIHVKAFAMKETVDHVLTHQIFIVGVASKKRKSHVLFSEIKLRLHSCVTSDATRKDHVDDISVMKFAVWTQNISAPWFVVVNSTVGFIDVKNPVIGAVVNHAGKQVPILNLSRGFDELTCYCGESVIYPPVPCGTQPPECKKTCTRPHDCDHPGIQLKYANKTVMAFISLWLQCTIHVIVRRSVHPVLISLRNGVWASMKIAAISIATKLTDLQLGDSVEISRLITKKEMKQARLQCDEECLALQRNRRLAEALEIDDNSDPFNIRSSGPKYSDILKEDARKDLKFVSDIEKEMRMLVEAVNKVQDFALLLAEIPKVSVSSFFQPVKLMLDGSTPPGPSATPPNFVSLANSLRGKHTKKSHCYPPMNRDHRRIIHELAQVYGIESVSYDNEPKRNVVITAVKGKSICPSNTLTSVLDKEMQSRPPPPIPHYKQTDRSSGNIGLSKPLKEEPVIDYFDVQD
ncbi:hypothetical protein BTVI_05604 [Pitangus sulphuratus]|nr:hypothetical protein BTVI_05604 [Pitangus sulphuratus]